MKFSELEHWPVYDTPYEVEDGFGNYTEVIAAGADDGARVLRDADAPAAMIVAEQEWNEDFSVRKILQISAIKRR